MGLGSQIVRKDCMDGRLGGVATVFFELFGGLQGGPCRGFAFDLVSYSVSHIQVCFLVSKREENQTHRESE